MSKQIPQLLSRYMELDNIAPELNDDFLAKLGAQVTKTANDDKASREEWFDLYVKAKKLISSKTVVKNYPWDKASNVHIPTLKAAILQFNAHTNPEIIKGEDAVRVAIMKTKPTEQDEKRAEKIASHMSYQLLGASGSWRIGTDKLISNLGLAGTTFRKTYYDSINNCPKSIFCEPESVYIDNDVKSLDDADRITHRYTLTTNELISRMRSGMFTEIDIKELQEKVDVDEHTINTDEKHEIFEQHMYMDLDDDGYKEPYVTTLHCKSRKILRILARYDEESFVMEGKKLIEIKEIKYFTDYHLILNPDGSFWSWGFADLLYHLNLASNSILNNLIDAGSLQNLGGGFIALNARLRKREIKRRMGEYVQVDVPTGTTLAQSIYDVPAAQPSQVLFQLLGFVDEKSQDVSSVNKLTLGELPGPNVQPTTIAQLLEQGGKVYDAIMTRLYYAFQSEYKKIFALNRKYLDDENKYYYQKQSGSVTLEDYRKDDYNIFPVLDPNLSTQSKRLAQAQALQSLKGDPGVDIYEINKRLLESLHIIDIDKVLPPPPTPEEKEKMGPTMQEQLEQVDLEKKHLENELIASKRNYYVQKPEIEILDLEIKEKEAQADAAKKGSDATKDKIESAIAIDEAEAGLGQKSIDQALQLTEKIADTTTPDFSEVEQGMQQLGAGPGGADQAQPQPEQEAQPQQPIPGEQPT